MTYLIAEIGVNWDGDFELLTQIMKNSKTAGFDSVKFQSFNEKIVSNHPEKNRLLKSAVNESNIEEINHLAQKIGIEWFCTPMYLEAVSLIAPFVKRFKIREFDGRELLENKSSPIVEEIIKTNKPIFVSVEKNPKNSIYFNNSNIKWLYCIPKYPCQLKEINFEQIGNFDGYSNHCQNIIAPITASILGASIVEVHVTNDKNADFIDNSVSFDFEEQKIIGKLIRDSDQIKK